MDALFLCQFSRRPRHGFTMTELMVVVAIIAVLAGILLTAMGGVRRRALSTQTESTMQEFAKACEAFQIEHNRYPGVIPEQALVEISDPATEISGTENALLHLMGGYRVLTPFDPDTGPIVDEYDNYGNGSTGVREYSFGTGSNLWDLKVDINRIGEGPKIDGKIYAPYFTPSEAALQAVEGQIGGPDNPEDEHPRLPDLVDAWGQPIVFVRRARSTGPLVGDTANPPPPQSPPQFITASMKPYTESDKLGRARADQTEQSILSHAPDTEQLSIFAQIIRHPAFGDPAEPLNGTARGAFVLFSAGPDGVYFSRKDGPGSPKNAIAGSGPDSLSYEDLLELGPQVVQEFDDLRVFGGG